MSESAPASTHDKRMADDLVGIVHHLDQVMADSAYLGLDETWGVGLWTPVKRANGGRLTQYQRMCNQAIQLVRNAVERVIGDMKMTVGALSHNIRDSNSGNLVNHLWTFAAALHNLRIWNSAHEETDFGQALEYVTTTVTDQMERFEARGENDDEEEPPLSDDEDRPSLPTIAARVRAVTARNYFHQRNQQVEDDPDFDAGDDLEEGAPLSSPHTPMPNQSPVEPDRSPSPSRSIASVTPSQASTSSDGSQRGRRKKRGRSRGAKRSRNSQSPKSEEEETLSPPAKKRRH